MNQEQRLIELFNNATYPIQNAIINMLEAVQTMQEDYQALIRTETANNYFVGVADGRRQILEDDGK